MNSRQSCRFLDFWRPWPYAKIPEKCRDFVYKFTTIFGRVTVWLGREDSNRDMANWKVDALACPRDGAEPLSVEIHK